MSRDMTVDMHAGVGADVIRPAVLVRLELASGIIAVHSAVGSFDFNGDTYLGVGNYGGLSEIREDNSIAPSGVVGSLSGIPLEYRSLVLDEHYQGRPATIYKALADAAHELISDPVLAFRGRCDYADIKVDKTISIDLRIASRLADWNRPRIRRYTHEDQQQRYPGDMGLEFIAQMVEKSIVWGRG